MSAPILQYTKNHDMICYYCLFTKYQPQSYSHRAIKLMDATSSLLQKFLSRDVRRCVRQRRGEHLVYPNSLLKQEMDPIQGFQSSFQECYLTHLWVIKMFLVMIDRIMYIWLLVNWLTSKFVKLTIFNQHKKKKPMSKSVSSSIVTPFKAIFKEL